MSKLIKILYQSDVFQGAGTVLENMIVEHYAGMGRDDMALDEILDRHVSEVLGLPYRYRIELQRDKAAMLYPDFMAVVYPEHFYEMEDSDHFCAYMDTDNKIAFYKHYVQGDCGQTWFTVS